jgi:hypothetical protein
MRRGAEVVKTKGRITISSVNSSLSDDYINISVTDKVSGTEVVHVKLSHEDFARALTGQGYIPAELQVFKSDNFGKKLEVRTINVPVKLSAYGGNDISLLQEAAKPFEKNGWKLQDSEINSRRYDREGGMYSSTFYRHVEIKEETK